MTKDVPSRDELTVTSSGQPRWAVAVGLALLAVVAVLVMSSPSAIDRSDDVAESTTTTTRSPSTAFVSTSSPESAAADDEPRVASVGAPVRAVIGSPVGLDPRLGTWPAGGQSTLRIVPQLFDYSIDPTGTWLAARDRSLGAVDPTVAQPADLWVGPVDGEMSPVASDVVAFAWHADEADRIAWHRREASTTVGGTLVSAMLGQRADGAPVVQEEIEIEHPGDLVAWGAWGFALSQARANDLSVILRVDGSLVSEVEGTVNGVVDGSLLVSGFFTDPLLVDPISGASTSVNWLPPNTIVWTVASSPTNPELVALRITNNRVLGLGADRVVLVDVAEPSTEQRSISWPAPAVTDIAWDSTGSFFVFATQGALVGDTEISVIIVGFDSASSPPVIDTLAPREWVHALAVG